MRSRSPGCKTGGERTSPRFCLRRALLTVAFIVAGVVCLESVQAYGAGGLHASVATGLVQAQVIGVSGSGFTPNGYGSILECNDTPGEPTVTVGPPFDDMIPVGCSAPSLKHIVATDAEGSFSTTFEVHLSRKIGPPCNLGIKVLGRCSRRDSAGLRARADAQNYPCPPSPAQQAEGVTCSLVFYNTAQEVVATPISFLGGGGPVPKTLPTTTPPVTPISVPATTPATSPATAPSLAVTVPTTGTPAAGAPGSGSGAGSSGSSASTGSGSTTASAPSSGLAFTGLGTSGRLLALMGGLLLLLGLTLFVVDLGSLAWWLLGR